MRYYVYVLARPNGRPFYVGKGQGERMYNHEREARGGCKCHKCKVIRKIWRSGGDVARYVVFETDNEQEAYQYERETIALHGRANLTNITEGGEGNCMPGESNPSAKLTEAQVSEIRRRYVEDTTTIPALAVEFDVRPRTIGAIIRGEKWGGTHLRRSPEQHRLLHGGERGSMAKLTWAKVRDIRERYLAGGITAEALAAEHGVHQTKISAVIRNATWYDPAYTPPDDTKTRNVPDRNGVKHPRAIYTAEQVREMRRLYTEERLSLGELMRRYDAPFGTMTKILRNFSYKDPDYTPPSRRETYDRRMKLTPEVLEEIRRLRGEGRKLAELSQHFGISQGRISVLLRR